MVGLLCEFFIFGGKYVCLYPIGYALLVMVAKWYSSRARMLK